MFHKETCESRCEKWFQSPAAAAVVARQPRVWARRDTTKTACQTEVTNTKLRRIGRECGRLFYTLETIFWWIYDLVFKEARAKSSQQTRAALQGSMLVRIWASVSPCFLSHLPLTSVPFVHSPAQPGSDCVLTYVSACPCGMVSTNALLIRYDSLWGTSKARNLSILPGKETFGVRGDK